MKSQTEENKKRAVIYAQTSVLAVAATTGGHGGDTSSPLRVASGHEIETIATTERGPSLVRQGAVDLPLDGNPNDQLTGSNILILNQTDDEDVLLKSPNPMVSENTNPEKKDIEVAKEDKSPRRPVRSDGSKRAAGYKRSIRYLKQLDSRAALTAREKRLKRKHEYHVRKYESMAMNTTVVEVRPPVLSQGRVKAVEGPNRKGLHAKSGKAVVLTSSGSGVASSRDRAIISGGKRQRSGETQVSEGKRLKPSTSFPSAPELQVAILDRSHPEGRMTTDRWLILEERILRALVDALAHSEDDLFTAFDGAKWHKGVKIIGCGNEKALDFLKCTIQGSDELWPGMTVDVVPIDQIPYQTTVKVWVPPPVIEDEGILTLLKRQNKGLGSDDWRVIRGRARDKGDGKDLWLKVSSESVRLLRLSKGMVKFGLNHVRMILPAGGSKNES